MSESKKDKKHHDIEVKIGSFKLKTKNPFKKKKKHKKKSKNKKKHLMTKDNAELSFEYKDEIEGWVNQDNNNNIVTIEPGQSLFKEKEGEKKEDTVIHIDIVSGPLSIIHGVDKFLNKNFNIKGVLKGVHKNAKKHGIKHL